MKLIDMTVTNRIPLFTDSEAFLVADNTDYGLRISFDDEWDAGSKTVWLYLDGVGIIASAYTEDDVAHLPRITLPDTTFHALAVGVQQGSLQTTRNACIVVYPSAETQAALAIAAGTTQPWFVWVNKNILDVVNGNRRADRIAEEARSVLAEAQTAAEETRKNAENADADAEAAKLSAQTLAFPVFTVDERGHVIISHAERLGSTTFRLNEAGHLLVEV